MWAHVIRFCCTRLGDAYDTEALHKNEKSSYTATNIQYHKTSSKLLSVSSISTACYDRGEEENSNAEMLLSKNFHRYYLRTVDDDVEMSLIFLGETNLVNGIDA